MNEKQPDWVFLLWGQSNMAGRGEVLPEDRIPLPGILAWDDLREEWVPAIDPVFNDKPTAGSGLARSFARTIQSQFPERKIGLVPSAIGGSKLEEWAPGAHLFQRGLFQARRALKNGGELKGILWHQGEGDSGNEELANTYASRFAVTLREARTELGHASLPVVVGELGEFLKFHKGVDYYGVVNEQLQEICRSVSNVEWVSAAGGTDIGDTLHFNREAVITLGKRYAEAYLKKFL